MSSLFEPAGAGAWRATEWARSPWGPEALHGGAPAALLARACEGHEDDGSTRLTRLTVELVRPVPSETDLSVEVRTARPGKRIQLLEASLTAGGTEVARAVALRIQRAELELPEGSVIEEAVPSPPDGVEPLRPDWAWTGLHNGGMEIRVVEGEFFEPGPATAWFRLRHTVVPDEAPSPFQRVAAAADFGNGLSQMFGFDGWLFINPDLTVTVFREPEGEWIGLRARTFLDPNGTGLAEADLFDPNGRIGRGTQSLLVAKR